MTLAKFTRRICFLGLVFFATVLSVRSFTRTISIARRMEDDYTSQIAMIIDDADRALNSQISVEN